MKDLLMECIDELCLKCGSYELEHEGACDHCKWKQIKDRTYHDKSAYRGMLDLAEDLKATCEWEGCFDDDINWKCPFLNSNGTCDIEDPNCWIIREG